MRPRHTTLVAVAVSCALVMSAPIPVLSQLPKDPCAEITQAQVSSALGMNVSRGESINSLNSACAWTATAPSRARITVQFQVADSYSRIRNTQLPGIDNRPLAGVGDDAFSQTMAFSTTVPKMTTLFVRKGKIMVTVRTYGIPDAAKQLAAERAVAQAVVSNL